MIRRSGIWALLFLCLARLCGAAQPNILLFTADDLHAESLAVYGGQPANVTPHLDAFANEGMLFDQAHVNAAICAPSRAIIATGRYSHRSGAMGFMKAREDVPDIVTTLQNAGYLAGVLGKYGHSTPKRSMHWDDHFDRRDLGNGRSPTLYYQRAKTFLQRAKSESKPFYLMVNSHDPHRPFCDPDKVKGNEEMPSRLYRPEDVDVPGFVPDLPGVRVELAHYLNSTRRLDDTFGRVLDALDETGFADNTIVVFISDNGIAIPFAKCNAYFHSTRTPLLVRWPGTVQPASRDNTHLVSEVDFFPTFLAAAGVAAPEGLDGRSFLPLLKGGEQAGRAYVFTQIDSKAGGDSVPMRCVQNDRYAYIYNPFSDGQRWYRNNNEGQTMRAMERAANDDPAIAARVELFRYRVPEELYDLKKDPNCTHNLIGDPEHAKALAELQARLIAHMQKTDDPMLAAFRARDSRERVDEVLRETYGKGMDYKVKKKRRKNKRSNQG